jgi:hypothetical protein
MKCYKCEDELIDDNKSKEHIIPNSLGGRLNSYSLICKKCNNDFGNTIDEVLFNQLGFAADVVVKNKNRAKDNVKVILETAVGKKVAVGHALNPKSKLTINIPGKNEPVIIFGNSDDELRMVAYEKKAQLEKKFGEFTLIEKTEEPTPEKLHFKNNPALDTGVVEFGGVDYFRGIAKIMLNFFLIKRPNDKKPQNVIDFVNGKHSITPAFIYHPSHYTVHQLGDKEFTHILHLKGEKDEKAIYCYMELFNFEKFLCVFDNDYHGEDFHFTYCFDLINEKRIEKNIQITVNKYQIEDLKFISHSHRQQRVKAFNEFEKRVELLQLND